MIISSLEKIGELIYHFKPVLTINILAKKKKYFWDSMKLFVFFIPTIQTVLEEKIIQ